MDEQRLEGALELDEVVAGPRSVFDGVAASGGSLLVTREGEPVAVVMSIPAFERLARDHERLRLLALGELEAAAGEGHDLAEVLEDARALLAEN